MKLVLMGTNEWVVPIFERAAAEHDVISVFTRAPKPAGRKMDLQKSPVHIWAENRGIPVRHNVKDYDLQPDFVVVASFGVILRDNVLNSAPTINLHPSLLPKYRGPSPMLTAILNGDRETAVCLMDVVAAVDAGDIRMMRPIEIGINDTIRDLESRVSALSADMLSEYLRAPAAFPGHPQVGDPTLTRKFTSADLEIDWNKSAFEIHNQVRSIGGRTRIRNEDVKILETKLTDDNRLQIITIQPAGKKPMDFRAFLNGHQWLKTQGFHNVAI
jgi:methionyl-tRNA formyltransferase